MADLLEHLPPDAFRKAIHLLGKNLPAEAVAAAEAVMTMTTKEVEAEEGTKMI